MVFLLFGGFNKLQSEQNIFGKSKQAIRLNKTRKL